MVDTALEARDVIAFGPFALIPSERLLTRDGVAVPLGARALDALIALASHPNEPLSKRDLMNHVWPDVTVGEGSLRFQIAGLRKALGDGILGARYIVTLEGRGYRFVAPVSRFGDDLQSTARGAIRVVDTGMPNRAARMVGRDESAQRLSRELTASRFVTVVGAGGVGKTTLAVAVGHELREAFEGAVLFVDLGTVIDSRRVAGAVASMLGLALQADDPTPALVDYLRDKRLLLILDTCEHLVEAVARLAEGIFAGAQQVHILATSREALRAEGERVHRLLPLPVPAEDATLTAADALTYPSIQLFIERAEAQGARLDLNAEEAAIVASICRKVDGVALAIELAAGRVAGFGLRQTAMLLEERLALLWQGKRTAPPRQQTLKATLDWSYGLLSDLDRQVLRRLSVFIGPFTLDAARSVLEGDLEQVRILSAIESLAAKSMVALGDRGPTPRYQLLDTTRAYALELSAGADDLADLAVRHATYYRRWLERTGAAWLTLSSDAERGLQLFELANVRAALEWCFAAGGDTIVGIELAAAAVGVFWARCQYSEAHRWAERAVLELNVGNHPLRSGREEMQLQAVLGLSLMFARGQPAAAELSLNRSLKISEELGDANTQLQVLIPLLAFLTRTQDFKACVAHAERGATAAASTGDPAAMALASALYGMSLHFVGDLGRARLELEAGMRRTPAAERTGTIYLGSGHHLWAGVALARTLWLQGHVREAVQQAHQTVSESAALNEGQGLILDWAFSVFLWAGELEAAREHLDLMVGRAEANALTLTERDGFEGQLAIVRGDAERGVERLQACLLQLSSTHYELLSGFNISLAQGLAALGRIEEGLVLIEKAILDVEAQGDLSYLPELLRVKGRLLLLSPDKDDEAERCFEESLDLSRRQGAGSWELRTSVDVATLAMSRGRGDRVSALLRPVLNRFVGDQGNEDVRSAERLLQSCAS